MPIPAVSLTLALEEVDACENRVAVQTLIGANNNNNAQATTSVAANANGSVVERLEYLQALLLAKLINGSGTALATNKSLADAIGSTGSVLSYGAGSPLGAIGTELLLSVTVAATAILAAGVALTGTASGALLVQNVIIETDTVALGGGTNFEVESDNAAGLADILVTAVSGLGAKTTVDLDTADVTKQRTVLEAGKKLIAKASGTNMTGTGNVTIRFQFIRIAAGATIAAAAT